MNNGRLTVMMGAAPKDQLSIFMDPTGKGDFEAGLLFLHALSRLYPGLTWAQLQQPPFMAGWWTDFKHSVGDVKDGLGDIVSSTIGVISKSGGSAVRLATDPTVAASVSRAAGAIATGGTSEGAGGILGAIGSIFTPSGQQAVSDAGKQYKAGFGLDFSSPWVLGGGVILAGMLAMALLGRPRGRR